MTTVKIIETTNELIDRVIDDIDLLIEWAQTDSEHAVESRAYDTARDDQRRKSLLKSARVILDNCRR